MPRASKTKRRLNQKYKNNGIRGREARNSFNEGAHHARTAHHLRDYVPTGKQRIARDNETRAANRRRTSWLKRFGGA
jgi:hypothetical protein